MNLKIERIFGKVEENRALQEYEVREIVSQLPKNTKISIDYRNAVPEVSSFEECNPERALRILGSFTKFWGHGEGDFTGEIEVISWSKRRVVTINGFHQGLTGIFADKKVYWKDPNYRYEMWYNL